MIRRRVRYDLNVWIVDRDERMLRQSFSCGLDGVAALLAGIPDDGPQRPAPGLQLVA